MIDVIVGSILSAALVGLYFQQKRVLENQVQLKKAELSGDIHVNDFEYDGEDMKVTLSNLSGSELSSLFLRTEILPKKIDGMNIAVSKKQMQRIDENGFQFGMDAGLAPRELNVPFRGKPSVLYANEDGSDRIPSLTFFITELRDAGVEEVRCRMWVEATDQLDQTVKSKVLPWDKTIRIDPEEPVHQEPDLEQVLDKSISAAISGHESEY